TARNRPMSDRIDHHPATELLQGFGRGDLDDASWTAVEQHLEACDACRQTLNAFPENDLESLVRSAAGVAPAAARARLRLTPGFEIVEELGRGGMGVVYKAHQSGLTRTVALKRIHASACGDPEALARFQREARAVARLNHPNIVQIYEVGEQEG